MVTVENPKLTAEMVRSLVRLVTEWDCELSPARQAEMARGMGWCGLEQREGGRWYHAETGTWIPSRYDV